MSEKFNKPIGWLVDEGLMLVDPNDKYAIPLYRHPAPRTPTKKMAKDRIEKLEAALRDVVVTLNSEEIPYMVRNRYASAIAEEVLENNK